MSTIIFRTSNLSSITYWIFLNLLIFRFILAPLFQQQHQMQDIGEKFPRYIWSSFQHPASYSCPRFGSSSPLVPFFPVVLTLVLVLRVLYSFRSELNIWNFLVIKRKTSSIEVKFPPIKANRSPSLAVYLSFWVVVIGELKNSIWTIKSLKFS